jgi:hypothetical protein
MPPMPYLPLQGDAGKWLSAQVKNLTVLLFSLDKGLRGGILLGRFLHTGDSASHRHPNVVKNWLCMVKPPGDKSVWVTGEV